MDIIKCLLKEKKKKDKEDSACLYGALDITMSQHDLEATDQNSADSG